jgi:hypothetical protein
LDSITTVRRLVAFYVDEHNRVLPHSAFCGQTPDEMYFGIGDAILADLTSGAGRRAPGTGGSKPISVVRDMPVSRRGRMTIVPTTGRRLAAKPGEPETARRTSRWA